MEFGTGIERKMKLEDCKKGKRVMYVPQFARETGVVSSTNDMVAFVKYDNAEQEMVTGDEPYTAQATDPEDLMEI